MPAPENEAIAWPRVYRPTRFVRAVLGAGGALMIAVAVAALVSPAPQRACGTPEVSLTFSAVGALMGLVLVAFGALSIAVARHNYLVLHEDAIEIRSVLYDPRRVRKDAIVGVRSSGQAGTVVLELVGGKRLVVTLPAVDEVFVAWMASLRDLTREDAQRALEALVRSPALGPTEEDARRALARARGLASGGTLGVLGLVVAAMFYARPHPLFVAALVSAPLLVLAALALGRGLYSISGAPNEVRADLVVALMSPGPALALRALVDHRIVDHLPLLGWGIAGTLALGIALLALVPREDRRHALAATLVLVAYGWGVAVHANVLLDRSEPVRARVEVVERAITAGKGGGPDLLLAGSELNEPGMRVRVGRETYDAIEVGDEVCVARHDGALGARWLEVQRCD